MTTRGKVILALSIVLGLVVVMAMGGLVIWGFFKGAKKGTTVADRRLVITVQRLRDIGVETPDPECCGHFGAVPNFGSRLVTYTYNTPAGTQPSLYVHSQSEVMSSVSAMQSFRISLFALRTSMSAGGNRFEERPSLLTYGDDQYAAIIKNKAGEEVGNLFAFRKGGFTVMVVMVGVYFDDAERVKELFAPVVATIEERRRK
jgi:hypothetical protein